MTRDESTDAHCLQMAVYAFNATLGPEGLVPMLLVFGAIPRPARSTPSPTQLRCQLAIELGRDAVSEEQSLRLVAFALWHQAGPKGLEEPERLRLLPCGSPVLVYRHTTKNWTRPFKFISCEGETAVIQLPRGRKIFKSTCVKPVAPTASSQPKPQSQTGTGTVMKNQDSTAASEKGNRNADTTQNTPLNDYQTIDDKEDGLKAQDRRNGTAPGGHVSEEETYDMGKIQRKVNVKRGSKEEDVFAKSRKEELDGLLKDGTFTAVHRSKLKPNDLFFGSRFLYEIKRSWESFRRNSRVIAQAYADKEAAKIDTKAPTVQCFSQRVVTSIGASKPHLKSKLRDVTQAYIRSLSLLELAVYIEAPPEMCFPEGFVLQVLKPLYGISESGLHWYLTYLDHHLEKLGMICSRAYPCVLYRRGIRCLDGIIILQVDDSLGFGTDAFWKAEEDASTTFRVKPRTLL